VIYLDWNATTPPRADVLDAMAEASKTAWANPSSVHRHGGIARAYIEDARAALADLAGADVRDVILTSGGTEANNMAIRSAIEAWARSHASQVPHLIASYLEHPSVVETALALEREGKVAVSWLPALSDGVPDLDALRVLLAGGPAALICIQSVNHETGAVQPVGDVLELGRAHAVATHVDAVQAWGKVAQTWIEAPYRTLAVHKIRGPKGLGALITRPFEKVSRLLCGGAQERGLRAGTPDPIAAAGCAVAARNALCTHVQYAELAALRDAFEARVLAVRKDAFAVATKHRAPHVSNMVFPGVLSSELVAVLDVEGVSVSAGAACSAGTVEPSRVIDAMHGKAASASAVRVSMGLDTTEDMLRDAALVFERVLRRFA
jgi:cysteine desulfurase